MATSKETVQFEPEATPNFPVKPRRWYMIWMGQELQELPSAFHAFQVPFIPPGDGSATDKEKVISHLGAKLVNEAQAAHPGCSDLKIVISRGSGKWTGHFGIHLEGSI